MQLQVVIESHLPCALQAISGGMWIADNLNDGHMDYFFWLLAVLQVGGTL